MLTRTMTKWTSVAAVAACGAIGSAAYGATVEEMQKMLDSARTKFAEVEAEAKTVAQGIKELEAKIKFFTEQYEVTRSSRLRAIIEKATAQLKQMEVVASRLAFELEQLTKVIKELETKIGEQKPSRG